MKICLTCKKEFALDNFYLTTKRNNPYYHPHCILCERHRQGLKRQSKINPIHNIKNEVWAKLFNGEYELSNRGRIKILNKPYSIRLGKPTKANNGYYIFNFSINRRIIGKSIHRLLAELYIPNPNNYATVNHKNGIKTDNRLRNLEWCSYADNNKHARLNGLNNNIAENHFGCKLFNRDVLEIFNSSKSQSELSRQYKISKRIVSSIKTGLTWSSVTGKVYTKKRICRTAV